MRRNVFITGMGILSSAGANLAEARAKFISGMCCLTPIVNPRAAWLRAKFAGQLEDFAADANCPPEPETHDRHVRIALVAARETLNAAGVQPEKFGRRMGLIFSTCSGPMVLIEAHYERIIRGHPQLTEAELFAKRYYSGAQILAQTLGVNGLCTTVVTACSASTAAIALAADLIRCGMLDVALAGGADAFSVSTLAGFDGLKATTDGKCAPFSKPPGLNLGEAAAFVFLESAGSMRQRGARSHAKTRIIARRRSRVGAVSPGRCVARWLTPVYCPNKFPTSTHMAPALRPTTRPNARPSTKFSASTRQPFPSVQRNPWSATVLARRARSN
jgi:3-oxoacyl-(acyl-carrier-protein) synthase